MFLMESAVSSYQKMIHNAMGEEEQLKLELWIMIVSSYIDLNNDFY